ncbi:MAG: hypothetical protein M1821_006662 [Bathelium mastoideum]|nr:MAG: hypothetical protein M1821_006662 [Bathelium mastoideum]
MAEAFGVFAGSLELVGTVLKVRKLWKEVKDGPERVSDLLEEAEIVGRVLARVQESTLSEGARNPHYASCVAESALLCRRAVNSLHEIAELLDQKLNSGHKFRRKIAAVKTYLKKEDIGRLTQKLDRAVRLLCLANQSAQNAYLVANM